MVSGNVVITGSSTGIGRACALRLDKLGFRVFAGVRKLADGETLRKHASERLSPVHLDVTDSGSIADAVKLLGDAPLAGLVNNAGIVTAGPLEMVSIEQWRNQFEVNVIGQVAVIQAFLPKLRAGRGRIVNMGSIAGRSALPCAGPYVGSKHALEGITDSLRMEVRQWGINVSIIEPGAISTPIWDKSVAEADQSLGNASPEMIALYDPLIKGIKAGSADAARRAIPADEVAKAVEHALTAPKPKTRYVVGSDAKMRLVLNRLPDRTIDSLILKKLLLRYQVSLSPPITLRESVW